MTRAEMGDAHAVTVLRARKNRMRQFSTAVLTADDAESARQIVHAHLKPKARENGDLVYRVKDGGVVVDEAERIRVDAMSAGAVFLAVSLADARFQGRPLVVDGSDLFQRQVVHLVAQYGLAVTFKDPALETERKTLYSTFHEKTAEPEGIALEAYIRHRNALLEKFPDAWLPYRSWRDGQERGK